MLSQSHFYSMPAIRRKRRAPARQRRAPVRRKAPVRRRAAPGFFRRAAGAVGSGVYGLAKLAARLAVGKAVGMALGPVAGSIAGYAYGTRFPSRISGPVGSLIRGHGDYAISGGPGSNNPPMGPPSFQTKAPSAVGGIRISHREFIDDVQQSTAFSIRNFAINPGLFGTFPYLASLASSFEQYIIHGMVFYFRSTSGNAVSASNTSLGTVAMATQYNALAPAFQNKTQMENYMGAVSGAPVCDMLHPIECEARQTSVRALYVRSGSVPSGQDARMYDMGVFSLAVVGCQATTGTLGELWCTYDVELLKPRVVTGAGGIEALTDHFQLPSSLAGTTNWLTALDTPLSPTATSNVGGVCLNNTYTWPSAFDAGQWLVHYQARGVSTALTNAVTWALGTNLSAVNLFAVNTTGTSGITAGATATKQMSMQFARFNGNTAVGQNTISITAGTLPGSVTDGDFFVIEIAPQLLTLTERLQRIDESVFDDPLEIKKALCPQDFNNLITAWKSQTSERNFNKYVIQRRNYSDPMLALEFVHPLDQEEDNESAEVVRHPLDKLETKSNASKSIRK